MDLETRFELVKVTANTADQFSARLETRAVLRITYFVVFRFSVSYCEARDARVTKRRVRYFIWTCKDKVSRRSRRTCAFGGTTSFTTSDRSIAARLSPARLAVSCLCVRMLSAERENPSRFLRPSRKKKGKRR